MIAAATVVMAAVVTGSMMTGESVRSTLVRRVQERLGSTETIVFSRNSFFDGAISEAPPLAGNTRAALLSNGFISNAGRLIPVTVWGIDDESIPAGGAKINRTLADALSLGGAGKTPDADLVLRLPATGLVPAGSLFVTDNYTTSARFALAGVADVREGGNLSLKNEQVIPANIFVGRQELAAILKIDGKANLLLSSQTVNAETFAQIWKPAVSGIRTAAHGDYHEITSDRVFIPQELVETVRADNAGANRLFSYMVNSIASTDGDIPYSFVTAADSYAGLSLEKDGVILSDYAAERLHVQTGDRIDMAYFISGDLKTLSEEALALRVVAIVPIAMLQADTTLSAEFPGLSDVEKCTDWDSDMPIDMGRITGADEDYWAQYRTTPKAIVAYAAVAGRWSNAYGSATAIRTPDVPDTRRIEPSMAGIEVIHPRAAGLAAARGGVDFAQLFLALGIFIILSVVMLMRVTLAEMIFRRGEELALMRALGFDRGRMAAMLWRESLAVALRASIAGVAAGVVYTVLILMLLGSVWRGAVHTGGFGFFPSVPAVLTGLVVSAGLALTLLRIAIVRAVKRADKPLRARKASLRGAAKFNFSRIVRQGLAAGRQRMLTAFVTLASGVLIVFSVGLNRRGFADSSQLQGGTGGYSIWCETSVPVYHSINTKEGRDKLALGGLPDATDAMQIFRYGADDASCLNLNRAAQPTVLGVSMEDMRRSAFTIQQNSLADRDALFAYLQTATDSVIPVLVDETTLTWALQLHLGDTIRYATSRGRTVGLKLAATLGNSIFQGNLLMDKQLFGDVWEDIAGSEVILFKTAESNVEATQQLIGQALGEYGVSTMTTARRLQEFDSVTDTYLTIFLTLGGLGLLIGVMSFVLVVRKDLASRKEQIALLRSLGFADRRIAALLTTENLIVPLFAVGAGMLASLAGVSGGMANVGVGIWLTAAVFAAAIVASLIIFVRKSVQHELRAD
jgi:putative ABC transport system permease protein